LTIGALALIAHGHEQLNVRTANIDDKNFSLHARPPYLGGSVITAG
jgi:hypothetical protein